MPNYPEQSTNPGLQVSRDGGTHSFESVAFLHMNPLYTYARWMTCNSEDSSTLLHEAYAEGYRQWCDNRECRDIRLVLFRAVRSHIIQFREMEYRERLRHPGSAYPNTPGRTDDSEDPGDPPKEQVASFLEAVVRRALKSMPEEYASAIVLGELGTLADTEIAMIVNCSPEEVRWKIHAGRRMLSGALAKYRQIFAVEKAAEHSAIDGIPGTVPSVAAETVPGYMMFAPLSISSGPLSK